MKSSLSIKMACVFEDNLKIMAYNKRKAKRIEILPSNNNAKQTSGKKMKDGFSEDELELLNLIAEIIFSIILKETDE